MSKLETKVIFLDTSEIQSSNFATGKKMQELAAFSKKGFISLKVTSIVYNEVKARISKEIFKVKEDVKSTKFASRWMVLKHFPEFSSVFETLSFDAGTYIKQLQDRFAQFLQDFEIEIIDCNIASVEEVFKQYFENTYPFNGEEKKSEFPDAFTLNTIEKWCLKNNQRAIILSSDNDIKNYTGKRVVPETDIAKLLDHINRDYYKAVTRIGIIESIYNDNKNIIVADIERLLPYELKDYLKDLHKTHNNEIDSIEIFSIDAFEIRDFSITHIDDNQAWIEMYGELSVDYRVEYVDRNAAFYDSEDDIWYGEKYEGTDMEESFSIRAQVKVDYNPVAGKDFRGYADVRILYFDD